MTRFRLMWQLFPSYLLVMVLLVAGVYGFERAAAPLGDRAWVDAVRWVSAGALVVLFAIGASAVVSRRLGGSVRAMTENAEHYARGDFGRRVPIPSSRELAELADAMNWMAVQLHEKIQTIQNQRNEQEAVLGSMVEGVLAVDDAQRVININDSLAHLLGIDSVWAYNRNVIEVIRNSDLQRFIRQTFERETPLEAALVLPGDLPGEERHLHVHGTLMRDESGLPMGALLVLNDVTRMRRLEGMRRDFVANVSHELKTPITSIKGFVETLLDGAMDDADTARRFLGIVDRHADRLSAIIDDLLSLSRIEQESDQHRVIRAHTPLEVVLQGAVDMCRARAEEKSIELCTHCAGDSQAELNRDLMEQALVNLIVNAIKYSPAASRVTMSCGLEGAEAWFRVADEGVGIAREHLPRLFERFYRVDKARSREVGGTGLGLAIVKHIAQAHAGRVDVDSRVGRGSTFTIRIPRNAP